MFERKKGRNNFYQQKMKLKNIKSITIVNQSAGGKQDEAPVQNIYINKSLTQENCNLLKEAKYQYIGYTVNGEIIELERVQMRITYQFYVRVT